MIEICFLWQVIHRYKEIGKILLFLLMYNDSCHKLVAKGTSERKWFKLPHEWHNVALFYKKV